MNGFSVSFGPSIEECNSWEPTFNKLTSVHFGFFNRIPKELDDMPDSHYLAIATAIKSFNQKYEGSWCIGFAYGLHNSYYALVITLKFQKAACAAEDDYIFMDYIITKHRSEEAALKSCKRNKNKLKEK